MVNPLHRLSDWGFTWLFRKYRIGSFEGIQLSSLRDNTEDFLRVITRSLELIRDHDARRFRRVVKQVASLANTPLAGGAYSATYLHRIKVARIDFELSDTIGDELFHVAYFAGVIVHEATHGVIRDHGIDTTPENRIQVEHLCRAEENRFINRLRNSFPELPESLIRPFDPSDWNESWNLSPLKRGLMELKRGNEKKIH
jgi:hypothetical protein